MLREYKEEDCNAPIFQVDMTWNIRFRNPTFQPR